MPARTYTLRPDLFTSTWAISVTELHDNDLSEAILDLFLATSDDSFVGVAAFYGSKCVLKDLALSTRSSVLVVRLAPRTHRQRTTKYPRLIQTKILGNQNLTKLAFDAERVSTALYLDHGLFINSLVDIQSLDTQRRWSVEASLHAFRNTAYNRKQLLQAFDEDVKSDMEERRAALRAWATWRATRPEPAQTVLSIDVGLLKPNVSRQ